MTRGIRSHHPVSSGQDPKSRIEGAIMILLLLATLVLAFPRG